MMYGGNKVRNHFPKSYPNDLYDRIIADGADHNTFDPVYRVAVSGEINRDTFLSTFEECTAQESSLVNRDLSLRQSTDDYDIGEYSVSFFEERKHADRILKLKKKYNDGPVLIHGKILPEHGFSIMTKDSNDPKRKNKKDSHIDLWKYEDVDLTCLFTKMETQ